MQHTFKTHTHLLTRRPDSEGRPAAQPPGACARTQKVAWPRCCRVQIAAPRCPRRSPARLGHRSRRPNKQQRKTGSYTALPAACRSPEVGHPPPSSSAAEPPFKAPSAAMLCRRIKRDMILSQPGAWSAEPSGLLSAPWDHRSMSPRILPPVLGRVRRSWRFFFMEPRFLMKHNTKTTQQA